MKKNNLKIGQKIAWIDPAGETSGVYEVVELYDDYAALTNGVSYTEALYDELQALEDTYCCPQCGCVDIQEQGWFEVNSPTAKIIDMVEGGTIWCPECNGEISSGSVTCNVYLKNKVYNEKEKAPDN